MEKKRRTLTTMRARPFSQSVAYRVFEARSGPAMLLKFPLLRYIVLARCDILVSLGHVTFYVSFVIGIVMDVVTLISARLCVHDALIMGS